MKRLILILGQHGINSLIIDGKLFGKTVISFGSLIFVEYEEVTQGNIYNYLGY